MLRAVCAPVGFVNKVVDIGGELRAGVAVIPAGVVKLAEDMISTMHASHGIGLAANQVGHCIRLIVMANGSAPLAMINPEIVKASGEQYSMEGCLSVQNGFKRGAVKRAKRVTVGYTDLQGVRRALKMQGLWAACAQHEIDHLDGKLFIDYLSNGDTT